MADSPNVKAIGINCSSPKFIKSLLQAGAPYQKDKVYVVYPNSGEKYDGNAKEFYGNSRVVEIIDELDDWIELGVRVIGGCCRVLPNDIKKIAERVNKMT
jgi:homocysteine S-methyltransferase